MMIPSKSLREQIIAELRDLCLTLIDADTAVVMPEEPSERVLSNISDDVDAMFDGRGGSCEAIFFGIRAALKQDSEKGE